MDEEAVDIGPVESLLLGVPDCALSAQIFYGRYANRIADDERGGHIQPLLDSIKARAIAA